MVLPVSGKGNHLLLRVLGQRKGPQGFIWAKMVPQSGLSVVTSHQGATALQFTAGVITKEEDVYSLQFTVYNSLAQSASKHKHIAVYTL